MEHQPQLRTNEVGNVWGWEGQGSQVIHGEEQQFSLQQRSISRCRCNLDHLLQLSRLKQLDDNICTTDELPAEIQLWNGWPVTKVL